jgi:hypothetical protein
MAQNKLLWVEVDAHVSHIRHYPQTEKRNSLHLFLTTYDWPSLSFSLLASAYFFLSGFGRDGCLVPSNASAQEDLSR